MRRIALLLALFMAVATTAHAASKNMWRSSEEVLSADTTGTAWTDLRGYATGAWGTPSLRNQVNLHAAKTLAGALWAVRKSPSVSADSMRGRVRDAILAAKRTCDESSEYYVDPTYDDQVYLAASRQVPDYILAADLIDLASFCSTCDDEFKTWLSGFLRIDFYDDISTGSPDLTDGIQKRFEYTGGHDSHGVTVTAARIYLGQADSLARADSLFRSYTNRSYYPLNAATAGWGDQDYFLRTYETGSSGQSSPCSTADTTYRPHPTWLASGNANKDWVTISPSFTAVDGADGYVALRYSASTGKPCMKFGADNTTENIDIDGAPVKSIERTCKSTCRCLFTASQYGGVAPCGGNTTRCDKYNECFGDTISPVYPGHDDWMPFHWPPDSVGMMYSWGDQQDLNIQAELLYRYGKYDAFTWGSSAPKRSMDFMHRAWYACDAAGLPYGKKYYDVSNIPVWMVNSRYGTTYPVTADSTSISETMGYTGWTHGGPKQIQAVDTLNSTTSVRMIFNAPRLANGTSGATEYDVRVNDIPTPFTESNYFTQVRFTNSIQAPGTDGGPDTITVQPLCPGRTYYIAIRSKHSTGYSGARFVTGVTRGEYNPGCADGWIESVGVGPMAAPEPRTSFYRLSEARELKDIYDLNGRKVNITRPGVYFQRTVSKAGVVSRRTVVVR